jgi:nucleoside-diphosphate-sugar epimerase
MSKILITGTTGFVGRAVCQRLRQSADHMLTGTTRQADLGSGPERVPLYQIPEIGPDTDWTHAVSGADIVIHLAARVHVMKDRAPDPLAAYRRVNTEGTRKLAEQAAAAGVKRFIFISTIKVAGENSPAGGFSEKDPAQPEDPYGVSKWQAEQALAEISETTGMEVVVLRPPLVYGPGVTGNFISLFNAIEKSRPLPLGAIQNQRSFIYVGNLADAIAVAAEHPSDRCQTFFVSDREAVSTPDLIRKIATSLNKQPRLINLPLGVLKLAGALTGKSSAIKRLIGSLTADTRHIQSQLGWSAPYTMEDGLKKTAEWFNSNKQKSG